MYEPGEVFISDEESDGPYPRYIDEDDIADPYIALPHSCDYWVIGNANNARALITDLQAAIERWEAKHGTV